jgi:hypothetical protein
MTHDPDLERCVDRALKQLPTPPAPPALLSNIIRGIDAIDTNDARDVAVPGAVVRAEWPIAVRVAFSAIGAFIVIGALLMWPLALEAARSVWYSPAVVLLRAAAATVQPLVPAALIYVTAMCVLCAAAASMLKHVALGGASNS